MAEIRQCMRKMLILLHADAPCIWAETYEEAAFIKDLSLSIKVPNSQFRASTIHVWSHTEGLSQVSSIDGIDSKPDENYMSPRKIMERIKESISQQKKNRNSRGDIYILRDLHLLIDSHEIKRMLRDVLENKPGNVSVPIIILSPITSVPIEIEKLVTTFKYDLPSREEIAKMLQFQIDAIGENNKNKNPLNQMALPDEAQKDRLVTSLLGLTNNEIELVLKLSIIKNNGFSLESILEHKIDMVQKSGVLDYVVPKVSLDDIGGNNNFKRWINEIKEAMSDDAKAFGVPQPKGYLSLGVPGCGKTMWAEATANLFGVPMLIFDVSKIFDRLVGNSEKRIDQAFRLAKACSPCVLLVDEVEKALGGVQSSNSSDSGVTNRIFGKFLQFMQEDTGVFVVLTSNDVSQLPPEFMRAGRLAGQWYFALPTEEERRDIVSIHMKRVGRPIDDSLMYNAINVTANYSGAEICETINNAMRKAYVRFKQDGIRDLTAEDIAGAAREITPIYNYRSETIAFLESYADTRATRASSVDRTTVSGGNSLDNIIRLSANINGGGF